MLFLLNQDLFDIQDPWAAARQIGGVADAPDLLDLVGLGQLAAFGALGLENAHPEVRRMLATMFLLTTKVNCALFLCPVDATRAGQVAVRLGNAPFMTMAQLSGAQRDGRLTHQLINDRVWRLAAAPAAA